VETAREFGGRYSLRLVCRLLGVPRSTVLYNGQPARDLSSLSVVIQTNLVTFPCFGLRRMYALLKRQRVACTRAEVRQVYVALKLLGKRAPPRISTTDSRHEHPRHPNLAWNLEVKRPDQLWVADTLELKVAGRKAFLALLKDVYTRRVMGFAVGHRNDSILTRAALEMGLSRGRPEIHHSDQGKTYAALEYTKRLIGVGAMLSMAAVGRAWENGFAERLNKTFREEEIMRSEYDSLQEAHNSIADYVKLYNQERIHQSLRYNTPNEVLEAHGQDQSEGL
jgi:transposase InsO family protein